MPQAGTIMDRTSDSGKRARFCRGERKSIGERCWGGVTGHRHQVARHQIPVLLRVRPADNRDEQVHLVMSECLPGILR